MYNYNKEFEEIVISKDFETKTYASSEYISAMIDRMKEEDEIAFEDFVANFAGFVFWYVKSRINADDDMIRQLVLDTFQRAYFKIKGFHYNDKKAVLPPCDHELREVVPFCNPKEQLQTCHLVY